MSTHKRWSLEEDQRIKAFCQDADVSVNDMAERLGVHRNQLMRRMKKLGVSKADAIWTDDRIAFITEQVPRRGYEHCAKKLGLTVESVRMKARRLGLASPRPRTNQWTKAEDELVCLRREQGVSFADIASELGRTQEAARYRFKVLRGVAPATDSIREAWYVSLRGPSVSLDELFAGNELLPETHHVVLSKSVDLARRWGSGWYVAEIMWAGAGSPVVETDDFFAGNHPSDVPFIVSDLAGADDITPSDVDLRAAVFPVGTPPKGVSARILEASELAELTGGLWFNTPYFPSDPGWEERQEHDFSLCFGAISVSLDQFLEDLRTPYLADLDENDPAWASVSFVPLSFSDSGRQHSLVEWLALKTDLPQFDVLVHGLPSGLPMDVLSLWSARKSYRNQVSGGDAQVAAAITPHTDARPAP